MPRLVKETSAVLRLIVFGAYFLGFVFCVAGIWLVYLGATGSTEFTFFGQRFKSANVGIAALFLGASTVVLLLRRSLKTLDKAIGTEKLATPRDGAPLEHWPKKKTLKSLEQKIKALSANQWLILRAVALSEGMPAFSLLERLEMGDDASEFIGDSELYYRLSGLEREELVTMDERDNVYLAAKVKKVLGNMRLDQLRRRNGPA